MASSAISLYDCAHYGYATREVKALYQGARTVASSVKSRDGNEVWGPEELAGGRVT